MLIGKIIFYVGMCFIDTQGKGYVKITYLSQNKIAFDMFADNGMFLSKVALPVSIVAESSEHLVQIPCPDRR